MKYIILIIMLVIMSTPVFSYNIIDENKVKSDGDLNCWNGDIYNVNTKKIVIRCEADEFCGFNWKVYDDIKEDEFICRKISLARKCGTSIFHSPYVKDSMTDYLTGCNSDADCHTKFKDHPFSNLWGCKYNHCCYSDSCDKTIWYYNLIANHIDVVGPRGVIRLIGTPSQLGLIQNGFPIYPLSEQQLDELYEQGAVISNVGTTTGGTTTTTTGTTSTGTSSTSTSNDFLKDDSIIEGYSNLIVIGGLFLLFMMVTIISKGGRK